MAATYDLTNGIQDEFASLFRRVQNSYDENPRLDDDGEQQRRMVWATMFYELGKKDGN